MYAGLLAREPDPDGEAVYVAALLFMGLLAYGGKLGRTRPILPGELMVSD